MSNSYKECMAAQRWTGNILEWPRRYLEFPS